VSAAAASDRAERLRPHLGENDLDYLVVTDLFNVRWLTGFTGTSGLALLGADRQVFVTDFRYTEQAAAQTAGFEQAPAETELLDALPALVGTSKSKRKGLRIGFDDAKLSVRTHAKLQETVSGAELVAAGGMVEDEREIKDASELERIRAAAALADAAFREAVEPGIAGKTERRLAYELEDAMRRLGASDPSFPSIVASGEHSSRPHAEPRDTEIERDTLVTIDWGAHLDGYCSDCTRTVATGEIPDAMRVVYELVLDAQRASLEAVAPGPTGRQVDAVARDIIKAAGHGEHFGHGLGHGVGLEVHEGPRLSVRGKAQLRAGHVVTVEPGVYVPGDFGVRIEDLAVVTEDRHEVFSSLPKELTVVG
jgi:Xaa-Pro aminopeptidase